MRQEKNIRPALLWMGSVAGRAKFSVGVLLLVQAVLGICSVIYAMLLREIVNAAVSQDKSGFFVSAAAFVGLVLFQIALRAVNRFFEEFCRSGMENRFKEQLFSALMTKDYASVTQVNSGEWINRLTSDTVVVADGIAQILPGVAGMTVKMIGALAAILYLEPRFIYILIPGGFLLICFTYGFRKVLKRLHKKIQEADGRLRVFFQERLTSLLIVRTFAKEGQTIDGARQFMRAHRAARMKRNHFSNFCNIGFGAAMNGAYVLGAVFCGYGILTQTMSYGNLMAVLQLIGQIQNPFANITGYLPKYYAMLASAERLMEAEGFADDCAGEVISPSERKDFYEQEFLGIGVEDASFTYQPPAENPDGVPVMPVVLAGLSLEIKKGEYVAFTGPSGCGKSTVLKLMMCLYPLDSGSRYLLTNSGRQPLTARWRGLFAYVPQGNHLMSGTIREIVAFGDSGKMRQEERLSYALRVACADTFVNELELGMDTLLGERGTGISEGQMQRIAIARAIFSDNPVLLLDEATSSLDEATEEKLLENLKAMTDKTVIIVTHRPAVLSICDKNIHFGEALQS
ncbi:MAG: ABC transporter ATP-binding protein [Eubacterium sp.]|nr:ABC transporter ATP-binding protein [Eubacterium sp.]